MNFKPTKEQERIFNFIINRPENILIKAFAGCGKCLGVNTPILMYDGSIKFVQNINIGDMIMGDDSTPRKVLNINTGFGELYNIVPTKGSSWVCNDIHVMTIHHEIKKEIIDIPLNEIDYPKYPNGNYRYARLIRTGVAFKEQKVNIDPYLLGLWLGDGTKEFGSPVIHVHKSEKPILEYLANVKYDNIVPKFNEYQKDLFSVSLTTPNFHSNIKNVLRDEFKKCLNIDGGFSIPRNYLINSSENRLKLLAGIIDTDGHIQRKYYEITTKYKSFADDLLYLARSLGFAAYCMKKIGRIKSIDFIGNYWRVHISGSFENIPCLLERKKCIPRKQIKSVLRTGFKKIFYEFGDYYGFTLDSNGRFLLGDFTVTHNTSTVVQAVNLLPKDKSITFLAFNKHIQEELKTKLPDYVRCYTTYGIGMAAIKRKYGDKIQFDEFKADKIILKKSKSWELHDEFKTDEEIEFYLNSIKKLVNLCRLSLTLKSEYILYIAERHDILNLNKPKDIKRVLKVLDIMTIDRSTYDFTDMVFLPAIDNAIWMFPQDYVFVDEIQDVNRCQIKLIEKILKRDRKTGKTIGRLITVGDSFQGIYGFNCADEKAFEFFENFPNTKILPLSYSFRCSKNVILKAQEIVPDIKALDDAPDGVVRKGSAINEAESGDFILCRTTMPLVKLFFEFLIQGKKAIVKGSDIGVHLIELIGDIKNTNLLIEFWEKELDVFSNDLKNKGVLNPDEHSGYVALEDKVSVLIFLAKLSNNIDDLKLKIRTIFTDEIKGICLSTVHKAKGLEAKRVFIIRPDLLPLPNVKSWQWIQEKNLVYVAITRAKMELIYDNEWTDETD